jgi:hypothetical protein
MWELAKAFWFGAVHTLEREIDGEPSGGFMSIRTGRKLQFVGMPTRRQE